MPEIPSMTDELKWVWASVEYMLRDENQDRTMALEMSQDMIGDIIAGQFDAVQNYIRHYSTTIDGNADLDAIVREIGILMVQEENS